MILSGEEILKQVLHGRIVIKPFDQNQINPNSYDFRLGDTLKVYKNEILDPAIKQETETILLDYKGYTLQSNKIYLGHTVEIMGSNFYVPIIKGKSSIARLGLFIHVTADLIDIGSINQWTLQLHAVEPLKVYPNMLIGQVTFWNIMGDIKLYTGKYQGSMGPMESKIQNEIK